MADQRLAPPPIHIRRAEAADAEAAIEAIRQSIIKLCIADHHDDIDILDLWLENKTPAHFLAWLAIPDNCLVVAHDADGVVAGVAGCLESGEVTLNHVAPHARLRGVSKAHVAWIEDHLRGLGVAECRLISTATAHRFYLAAGYRDNGQPIPWGGTLSQPMRKAL